MKERDGAHLNRRTGGKPFVIIYKNIFAAGTPGLKYFLAVCLGLNRSSGMDAAMEFRVRWEWACQVTNGTAPRGQYRYSGWKYGTGLVAAWLLKDSFQNHIAKELEILQY